MKQQRPWPVCAALLCIIAASPARAHTEPSLLWFAAGAHGTPCPEARCADGLGCHPTRSQCLDAPQLWITFERVYGCNPDLYVQTSVTNAGELDYNGELDASVFGSGTAREWTELCQPGIEGPECPAGGALITRPLSGFGYASGVDVPAGDTVQVELPLSIDSWFTQVSANFTVWTWNADSSVEGIGAQWSGPNPPPDTGAEICL